jgi:hypothetical protein
MPKLKSEMRYLQIQLFFFLFFLSRLKYVNGESPLFMLWTDSETPLNLLNDRITPREQKTLRIFLLDYEVK